MGHDDAQRLGAAMGRWLRGRHRRGEISEVSARTNRVHVDSFVGHTGEHTPLGAVTIDDVEDWLDSLAERGLVAASRNVYLSTVRTFFEHAVGRRLLPASPVAGVRPAKVPKRKPRRVPRQAVGQVLFTADFRARVMITLAVGLGLRRSEIAGLQVEDWDRAGRTLLVRGKGDKERVLPVEDSDVLAVLDAWVGERVSGPMWPSARRVEGLSPGQVGAIVTKASTRVPGRRVTPHQYRHTFAIEAVMAGTPTVVVRDYLGHESVATTNLYLDATGAELRDQLRGSHGYGAGQGRGGERDLSATGRAQPLSPVRERGSP